MVIRSSYYYGGWLRNPAPVENGGKHPMIYRVSAIQGDAGIRWPIHSSCISKISAPLR